MFAPLLLLLACSPDPDTGDGATALDGGTTADGGATADGGTTGDGGVSDGGGGDGGGTDADLYGEWAKEQIPAPQFVATNMDGTGRAREDLLGHPTVMWFYPAAGTGG
ncbi:hypothetical protein L6R53_08070 [Myxococcota bacterium]|nr:hypothetical protein [Myxococcota bacterium]